jgi:hypothetical protein
MFYIFCNSNFQNAVYEIPLTSAKQVYCVNNPNCSVQDYEVWELSYSDFQTINECDWQTSWGWWRWTDGSLIEFSPTHTFIINGEEINLYYDEMSLKAYANNLLQDPYDEKYWPIVDANRIPEHIKEDYFLYNRMFNDIFDYCATIWQMKTEKNRADVIIANAKLNNLSVVDFLKKVAG